GLIVTVLIAVAGSTRIFYLVLRRMNRKLEDPRILVRGFSVNLIGIGTILMVILLFAMSSLIILSGTNNPFIYFRF
ncbi:MAG TPA: hypothetical protein VMC08_06190, partial [Bacteroidales bacterium]|nr:hypothetical protein [Bacteroidales bacterium]